MQNIFRLAIPFRAYGVDLKIARSRLVSLGARHAEISAVFSSDDSPGAASSRLLTMACLLIARTERISLPLLVERNAPSFAYVWPGEHYRLLAALVQEMQPRQILEIGTYTGLSSLAMLSVLPANSRLTTVDVIPWNQISGTFLRESDFSDGRLAQLVCDFGDLDVCRRHQELLQGADLIFIDGPKDGVFERRLLNNFRRYTLKQEVLLVLDDVRLWRMLDIWRQIPNPKLDLTSFGHWSGTGFVDWYGSKRKILEPETKRQVTHKGAAY